MKKKKKLFISLFQNFILFHFIFRRNFNSNKSKIDDVPFSQKVIESINNQVNQRLLLDSHTLPQKLEWVSACYSHVTIYRIVKGCVLPKWVNILLSSPVDTTKRFLYTHLVYVSG